MIKYYRLIRKILPYIVLTLILLIYLAYKLKHLHRSLNDLKEIEFRLKNIEHFNQSTLYFNVHEYSSQYYSTIITVYFSLNNSKHSNEDYQVWIQNMLFSIDAPLVVFTDFNTKDLVIKFRYGKPTILYIYDNVWQLMRELESYRNKSPFYYINSYVYHQTRLDEEKLIHNPNLYAIWNLKPYLSAKVSRDNPFETNFFIYTDMGAWRYGLISYWPNQTFVKEINEIINDRVLLSQIEEYGFNNNNNFEPYMDIIQGGFFAGTQKALLNFEQIFYDLHDERLIDGYFIGKDQTFFNILTFQTHSSQISRLESFNYKKCIHKFDWNPWLFYQIFFSSLMDKYFECEKILLIE
jgi:hypothetical protein